MWGLWVRKKIALQYRIDLKRFIPLRLQSEFSSKDSKYQSELDQLNQQTHFQASPRLPIPSFQHVVKIKRASTPAQTSPYIQPPFPSYLSHRRHISTSSLSPDYPKLHPSPFQTPKRLVPTHLPHPVPFPPQVLKTLRHRYQNRNDKPSYQDLGFCGRISYHILPSRTSGILNLNPASLHVIHDSF